MSEAVINLDQIRDFVARGVEQYETSSPAVSRYLDALYITIDEKPQDVSLFEMMWVGRLMTETGWMDGNYAQNHIYHLLDRLNKPTPITSY